MTSRPGCRFAASSIIPTVQRHSSFNSASIRHVNYFKGILGSFAVITDQAQLQKFNHDWMGRYKGASKLALQPNTTEQVAAIMQYCNWNKFPVVPQGGNTGLVGGSVPVFDEIILSLSAMNNIESFDSSSGVVITQAGVVLQTLDKHVAASGYRIPLDIGARRVCQIGGNVATNAAGSRFIRYGSLRGSILGLEAVLPDGRVLNTLTLMRKDNTGYDLKQLYVGSEGTLGVITRLAIACPVRSTDVHTMIFRIDSFDRVKALLQLAKQTLGQLLSAIEFMDEASIQLAKTHLPDLSDPFPQDQPRDGTGAGLILVECAGSSHDHTREKLCVLLDAANNENMIVCGVIADDDMEAAKLWHFRESLPKAVLEAGKASTLKYDLSLSLETFYECVVETRKRVVDLNGVQVVAWGHIGDGNLHLNVVIEDSDVVLVVAERLQPWIYEFVADNGGSVSAEHGLGVMKAAAIGYSKTDVAVDMMRDMKNLLDPNGICNPYKVLPKRSHR